MDHESPRSSFEGEEAAGPSPVPGSWYRSSFGGEYLQVYRRRDATQARAEVAFTVRALSLRPGERVLDLCCGAGRHVDPLADAGLLVHALDLSLPLLRIGRSRLGAGARLVQGDMRHLPFARPFAGVLSFFTSFGYFMSEGDNVRVLREIARVLTPGGKLLLDLADRRSVVEGLVPQSSRREGELTIEERRWISSSGDRVEKEVRLLESGEERRLYESVRLYDLDEVCEALRGAGLRCLRTYGDFSGSPYPCEEGGRMVVVAERISD